MAGLNPGWPGSALTITGGDLRRNMVGAWFFSSPGPSGRMHNHAPNPSLLTQSAAVRDAVINNPFVGTWRGQSGAITFENSDNVAEASGAWTDLGDPIATTDDVTVLIGWIPFALTVPTGTSSGFMFGRGQDTFGNGWSIFTRHDGTDQVTLATVLGGVQQTATGVNAGLKPGIPNFMAGRCRQAVNVAVACNGRMLATTATGNSSLRTSTKGCRIGASTSSAVTSHHDPVMFVVLWRRALSDAEMQLITATPWVLWTQADLSADGFITFVSARMPIDFRGPATLAEKMPIEWRGQMYSSIPVEWTQGISTPARLPLFFAQGLTTGDILPIEVQGTLEFGLRWNVINPLKSPLMLSWDVLVHAAVFTLQMQWNVVQALAGLTLRWNVLPDVFTPFGIDPSTGEAIPPTPAAPGGVPSEDVQKPVATTTKTP